MSTSEADRFLSGIAACGWFEHLPLGADEQLRQAVTTAVVGGLEPRVGLAAVVVDSAYLLEASPYTALLRQFASASHGTFVPDHIVEERRDQATHLGFEVSGRGYGLELPPDADEIPGTFYDVIGRAMADSGTPLRFMEVKLLPWGPIPGFALAHPGAYAKAVAAKLLPASAQPTELSEEEMDEFAATIQVAMLGTETYYWRVDGTIVAEIVVPGKYEEMSNDLRDKGAGVETTLAYEGCGTITMACRPPSDEPMAIPRSFHVAARRDLADRLTQSGHTRIDKSDCAWRLDKMTGAPVHVLYIVEAKMGERFDRALDSIRLIEPSAEVATVFSSCLAPPVRAPRKRRASSARPKTARGKSHTGRKGEAPAAGRRRKRA
jgi:hypothetical protein